MGCTFQVPGQMGGLRPSDETSHRQEMEHNGIALFLALKISSKGWSTSDFPGNAGSNPEAE